MEVVIGKLAGFCGGVINSVNKTAELLNSKGRVYCLGELVHNKQVVEKLEHDGLVIVNCIDEVADSTELIIRAHGVSKDIYDEASKRNIKLYDLTCPNVLRIHEKACKYVEDGYFIILIAQKDHPEAVGTISFCGEDSIILGDEEQIAEVVDVVSKTKKAKIAIISQTTFSVVKFLKYVDMLKEKIEDKEILVDNTICSATDLRQKETTTLSKNVNTMIIIGSKNSSNTKKLYELAKENCSNTYIIETVSDIDESMSFGDKVGVMAGASTPKDSIDDVVEYLMNY